MGRCADVNVDSSYFVAVQIATKEKLQSTCVAFHLILFKKKK